MENLPHALNLLLVVIMLLLNTPTFGSAETQGHVVKRSTGVPYRLLVIIQCVGDDWVWYPDYYNMKSQKSKKIQENVCGLWGQDRSRSLYAKECKFHKVAPINKDYVHQGLLCKGTFTWETTYTDINVLQNLQDRLDRISGSECTIAVQDFNECNDNTYNDCDVNAKCYNKLGRHECKCKKGFVDVDKFGLGRSCKEKDGVIVEGGRNLLTWIYVMVAVIVVVIILIILCVCCTCRGGCVSHAPIAPMTRRIRPAHSNVYVDNSPRASHYFRAQQPVCAPDTGPPAGNNNITIVLKNDEKQPTNPAYGVQALTPRPVVNAGYTGVVTVPGKTYQTVDTQRYYSNAPIYP